MCKDCKYKTPCENLNYLDVANDCSDLRKFVDEIRADAIEEYRLALHKKYADNKYRYESNIEYWNLDMEEVDEIAEQLKEQNK